MLKPLMLSAILLAGTSLRAQEIVRPQPNILHGFETTALFIPYDCEEFRMSHGLLIKPLPRHTFVVGADIMIAIFDRIDIDNPSLLLGYRYGLKLVNEKWELKLIFDTRHRIDYGEAPVRYIYTGVDYRYDNDRNYFTYDMDVHSGLGATWNFQNDLALNMAIGPTLNVRYFRTMYDDYPESNYSRTRLDLHGYLSAGLVYKFSSIKL